MIGHMDGMFMDGPCMWWGMWVVPLLILGALVFFGVWAIRRFSGGPVRDAGPRRILEERFARGEIDAEEFERRLQVLGL